VERCDSLSHRLTELRNRLVGQINVVCLRVHRPTVTNYEAHGV
jgi:hypothetical protein